MPKDPISGVLPPGTRISNSCTIDNLLTVTSILVHHHEPLRRHFEQRRYIPVCSAPLNVYSFVNIGDWPSAELHWLDFTEHDYSSGEVNLVGDEAEKSFDYLAPLRVSSVTRVCLVLALTVPKCTGVVHLCWCKSMTATILNVLFFLCGSFFIQFQCVFASNVYIRVSVYIHAHAFKMTMH